MIVYACVYIYIICTKKYSLFKYLYFTFVHLQGYFAKFNKH